MRIATVNVNGIRATMKRGFADWLAKRSCDVVALQEVRAKPQDVPAEAIDGYHFAYHPGELAGRNGVALLSKHEFTDVREGFGHSSDREGRYLEADLDLDGWPLTVASLYLPKGGNGDNQPAELARYQAKLEFMAAFADYLQQATQTATERGREYLVMGDVNIAHTELDLRNWRGNQNTVGFKPEERAWVGSILHPAQLVDVVRELHPEREGPYSWWSWRGKAFDNDTGWRIDYHLATPGLAKAAIAGGTDRAPSYAERLSDHAPVVVDYAAAPAAA